MIRNFFLNFKKINNFFKLDVRNKIYAIVRFLNIKFFPSVFYKEKKNFSFHYFFFNFFFKYTNNPKKNFLVNELFYEEKNIKNL